MHATHSRAGSLRETVLDALQAQPVVDMHTHLYPPTFGTPAPGSSGKADADGAACCGAIDELVTYHYLVAEVYRVVPPTSCRTSSSGR